MDNILYKNKFTKAQYYKRTLSDYYNFCHSLIKTVSAITSRRSPVFLCIGTDRMTGDCLGPLVGHKLKRHCGSSLPLFGTLEHPVHALNLEYTLSLIRHQYDDPFLIAIDAALGLPGHIGRIGLSHEALNPGEGLRKELPPVGDLSITGIVASCHGDTSLLLQNTRLHLVNELADFIVSGLISSFPL